MAIYIFSLLVGYMPNGVDNAQGYRAGMLAEMGYDARYVFTELPTALCEPLQESGNCHGAHA